MGRNRFYRQILLLVAMHCSFTIGFAQTLSDLKADLDNARSNRARADVCFNISRKYADGLKVDSALYFAERVKEFSQKDNYETGRGKYHLALALAYHYRGLINDCRKNALEAINIFSIQKEYSLLGIAYWQLATAENVSGNAEHASRNYWTSAHFLIAANDKFNLFRTYFWLGRNYDNNSVYDSAASYYIKSLVLADELHDPFRIYTAATELGETFFSLRNYSKASQYLEYGLKFRSSSVHKVGTWVKQALYANCLYLLHDFTKADSVMREFEIMAKQFNNSWGWIILDKLKGIREYEMQNYPDAVKYLRSAFSKETQISENQSDRKDVVFNLARAEFKMKIYDSAITHLKYAGQIARSINALMDAMDADLLLSESFEKINRPDSSLYYYRRYSSLRESMLSVEKQKILTEVTARYESEKKEQEIRILQKESEAHSYMLQLKNQQIEKQQLEDDKKSQQIALISQQNEINKLDADQKALNLENEKKENERKQAKLEGLQKESALQSVIARNQEQRKNFAYGLMAAILIFSLYGYYRYRQNKKLSDRLTLSLAELKQAQEQLIKFEKEKASENIRVRISRDIHDEVGATLSGVALYSEIAKQKMEQHNEHDAQIYLDHISANSKDMVEKMGDIIWTINPTNDSVERIIEKLRSYAVNLCSGKGIQVHFQVDEEIKDSFPDMSERKNIYLFSKEAINNAVKYSGCLNIFFSIKMNINKTILEIKEDGKGFDEGIITAGNGLINMQARADELNADLRIDSKPGVGTCIQLHMKFHPIGGQKEIV